jgi:phosphate transport system permease protein
LSILTATNADTQFDVVETPNQIARKRKALGFRVILISAATFTIVALVTLLWTILKDGWSYLSWHLITDMPSRKPEISGLNSALWGTVWVIIRDLP